jgi:hypothetical protein
VLLLVRVSVKASTFHEHFLLLQLPAMPQRHMLEVVRVKELPRLGQAATTPHRRKIGQGHRIASYASAFASAGGYKAL